MTRGLKLHSGREAERKGENEREREGDREAYGVRKLAREREREIKS